MENKQAMRPNMFFTAPSFLSNEDAAKEGVTDEERILASGANTEFYKTLQTYIVEVMGELDKIASDAISAGQPFDEIGKNTVVLNLTKGIITKIFQKVQDAKEAVEAAETNTEDERARRQQTI